MQYGITVYMFTKELLAKKCQKQTKISKEEKCVYFRKYVEYEI